MHWSLSSLLGWMLLAGCGGPSAPCVISVVPLTASVAPGGSIKVTVSGTASDPTGASLVASAPQGGELHQVPDALATSSVWQWTAPSAAGTYGVTFKDGACSGASTLTVP